MQLGAKRPERIKTSLVDRAHEKFGDKKMFTGRGNSASEVDAAERPFHALRWSVKFF